MLLSRRQQLKTFSILCGMKDYGDYMWTVVYVSQNEQRARELTELFDSNKIICRVHNSGKNIENGCYEVLVPQTELDMAQDLIFENEF